MFVHVNDLLSDKNLMAPGVLVEFRVQEGDRGPKATGVTVLSAPALAAAPVPPRAPAVTDTDNEDLCDIVSARELEYELTELLLRTEPPLQATQIPDLRRRLVALAQTHGWADR